MNEPLTSAEQEMFLAIFKKATGHDLRPPSRNDSIGWICEVAAAVEGPYHRMLHPTPGQRRVWPTPFGPS